MPLYVGVPPNCRPECSSNSECSNNLACTNNKCTDPCIGACGTMAECRVVSHTPNCVCPQGHTGDPFIYCTVLLDTEPLQQPCTPSPCGSNAICKERNNAASCVCSSGYFGNPYEGCRPECSVNTDCSSNKICQQNKCRDPCPGTCGLNAQCQTINHSPMCVCIQGFTGNPFQNCVPIRDIVIPADPCSPSPCGPNSACKVINEQAVCSCKAEYQGVPPNCRPECIISAECPANKACVAQKCNDPCVGQCGQNAACHVINHSPICSCIERFTGDPFSRCYLMTAPVEFIKPSNPCLPSPCGPFSQCRETGGIPSCTCLPGYIGAPPQCRPECTINADCPSDTACINQKCKDPCPGSCGLNAQCLIKNHTPICTCIENYVGDAFTECKLQEISHDEIDPCNPSPCGTNAQCNNGECTCVPEYHGDPYFECRPECVLSSDCPQDKACIRNKCINPCNSGVCASNANCEVTSHIPMCRCPETMTGNAFANCVPMAVVRPEPCQPSPCGPNSQCRNINGQPVCSCLIGFTGSPPSCRPECSVSSDCLPSEACSNMKCVNPCQGACGVEAICQVINHNPICSCPVSYTGNPFIRCIVQTFEPVPTDPCIPSPCGPNSICKVTLEAPACSCLSGFVGSPPYCKPECISNSECPTHQACINQKCMDPCVGACGVNAQCYVISHSPSCSCLSGYTGNPFFDCHRMEAEPDFTSPCQPSPCGANAICKELNGAGSCTCQPDYYGNPNEGCRPECAINTDCPSNRACLQNKCRDPCPGACAPNAMCQVVNHAPQCSCPRGLTGDPFRYCTSEVVSDEPMDVCRPSPCGPNSRCREVNKQAVCSCLPNYMGTPPGCRPECTTSAECSKDKACINQKCQDPCTESCGINSECRVINHSPICQCKSQYTGDPFTRCSPIPPPVPNSELEPYRNPCLPSPCGPNAICQDIGNIPSCACMPTYIGSPPNCRPECTINSECPTSQACIQQKCRDPCLGSCGISALCSVSQHTPICTCPEGFTGDAFTSCAPRPPVADAIDQCSLSRCGTNAICTNGVCSCIPEHQGDPYVGCRPECVLSTDCTRNKACVDNKCTDPCKGTCAISAICDVINHVPMCSCPQGTTGNAFYECAPIQVPIITNPCRPSPCGPNSQCREINGQAVCTCVPGYRGSPPLCHPECTVSSDCPSNKACSNQKCIDPCVGSCGVEAKCAVVKHNPICSCSPKFTGNPFVRCVPFAPTQNDVGTPCTPSPCGPNSICKENSGTPSCTCMTDFFGSPPYCRPECSSNSECPSDKACINMKCANPCINACGVNAQCRTISHSPMCFCETGFTGDAFSNCYPHHQFTTVISRPCDPTPCGPNAVCKEQNSAGSCTCLPDYIGNPYEGCRPECTVNTDCISSKACIRNKCQDPCPGTCGTMATCVVVNHLPSCTCLSGFTGDPYQRCHIQTEPVLEQVTPCVPNPCGPNSVCRAVNGQSACSCMANYIGSPPGCRPECTVSSECSNDRACINQKCTDPCPGRCGSNSNCRVVKHSPLCSCASGFTGDPFTRCYPDQPIQLPPELTRYPCVPNPCGENAICRDMNGGPSCSCMPGYQGLPPNCRPECVINQDCPSNMACINMKCRDPCPGSCGQNAMCTVFNHSPACTCPQGYSGDSFVACILNPPEKDELPTDPCNPSPCGINTQCKNGICECIRDYQGDPYFGCKPECLSSTECPTDKVCSRNKCINPCPGMCAPNAECNVYNHIPICTCPEGTSGNAFTGCHTMDVTPIQPCNPSPCGPNSQCRSINNQAVCSCLPTFIGNPPSCRPECSISAECPLNEACNNHKCINPCIGTCGYGARCEVINHNPICSCPNQYTGNPFSQCIPIAATPVTQSNPCTPSPCGPYSVCKEIGESPSCTCQSDYIGAPPNCRPECVSNSECRTDLSCINQKCKDPCPGSCGYNADCKIVSHALVCTCPFGLTGDPLVSCNPMPDSIVFNSPCEPSPCGLNAECSERNGAGACRCIDTYLGNPYEGCRPECVINTDCPPMLACIQNKCKDPCPGVCGSNAICQVINHLPTCYCSPGLTGNPYSYCVNKVEDDVKPTPCTPSPCGPNSQCRDVNSQAVCSCLPEFMGSPPNCRPECTINSECPTDKACIQRKCTNPCIGQCARNANCRVISHNPMCSCQDRFTGDPFTNCVQMVIPVTPPPTEVNPCIPSPCGPNSECQVYGNSARCTCLPNYIDSPPRCRPECVTSAECSAAAACINSRCADPCPGACGRSAQCSVVNHLPICSCDPGSTGDPFFGCYPLQPAPADDPCLPSPCGTNAVCKDGTCTCLPEYRGDPYFICNPECVLNTECPKDKACINNKCKDPCVGTCGNNALCEVLNHIPMCSCPAGFTGSPFYDCTQVEHVPPANLCQPSPCGPNSQCREVNGHAVCICIQGFMGSPPNCRPECTISSDCQLNRACSNQKCIDPCPGACGRNTQCLVVNHNPVCTCLPGFSGDPFSSCQFIPSAPPVQVNPCLPSPCGPNSQCTENGENYICNCLPEFVGTPPNCRPECTSNTECPLNMACINRKCVNPCMNSCGENAECRVVSHTPICLCLNGYTGDPFLRCSIEIHATEQERPTPCIPSPCGANAECREQYNAGSCTCLQGYFGNPYEACKPECLLNSDCPSNLACRINKCHDPCPGSCGINAVCNVINHIPMCSCPDQYYGDPYKICTFKSQSEINGPCNPSPCGPNSQCKSQNGLAICTCLIDYQGSPPMCRPECITSSECPLDKACENLKCVQPCPKGCGVNTDCRVIKHNAICTCRQGYTGDPFTLCYKAPTSENEMMDFVNPCIPSPCGLNAMCRDVGGIASCSCNIGYFGAPPNCKPECVTNTDCNNDMACINMKCENPCLGSCGLNAICNVVNHVPMCSCSEGYQGDPFAICNIKPPESPQKIDPCYPSPCGVNAQCNNGDCTCLAEYYGDPYFGCRPECVLSTDCAQNQACLRSKCVDPCRSMCGVNTECNVYNHVAICSCATGMTGDPFTQCNEIKKPTNRPCQLSPCGPNSVCREVNDQAVCACIESFIGNPPNCRPECIQSTDCSPSRACINRKCQDPCPGSCGTNALCNVIKHNPICSCPDRYTGSPFTHCYVVLTEVTPSDPCVPSPCGPNSICTPTAGGATYTCTCQPSFEGTPPLCSRECTTSDDCSMDKACINYKCKDPCPGSCGINTVCVVRLHSPMCSCEEGYTGDPFTSCLIRPQATPVDPCDPTPCGSNAECKVSRNNAAACICRPGYFGNPYESCRPECVVHTDCAYNQACLKNKCVDPCPGTCGVSAMCQVINHVPSCSCTTGYTGNPYAYCHIVINISEPPKSPCQPNPCGSNSICNDNNGQVACSCKPGFLGSPPNCRPECTVNSECESTKSCSRQKCIDPCINTCGLNAECRVVNHAPICSCRQGFEGDPFIRCVIVENTPIPEANPCIPSPCGPNALCQTVNQVPVCTCMTNYIGSPPNCRPECTVNSDCPSTMACMNQKCRDPCPGSCGLQTVCQVYQHAAVCSCMEGFTGNPFQTCYVSEHIEPQPTVYDKCNPSPCGANAQCQDGQCTCKPKFLGNPYMSCRPECTHNSDCAPQRACVNNECRDPCINICGQGALCEVHNHIPMCSCPSNTTGNAFFSCNRIPVVPERKDPCSPSPCGPYSVCRVINKQAVCSCLIGYTGMPPSCRPECLVDSDCTSLMACSNQKCNNPCIGTCGLDAECRVHNHKPICYCRNGFTGDPFSRCFVAVDRDEPTKKTPCEPTPCGPNSICRANGDSPSCSCRTGFIGSPPYCRPECVTNSECSYDKACINTECVDPCPGACGRQAICRVISHSPQCVCESGYEGNALDQCQPIKDRTPVITSKPCLPNPCGINAICQERNDVGSCTCLNGYFGNPYEGCRPECLINSDCPNNKACMNNKCQDPCPGLCGSNTQCQMVNHYPKCICLDRYVGNPYDGCSLKEEMPTNPCNPSPCGPYSTCRALNGQAMCTCIPEYFGSPPNCRPECITNAECPSNKACIKQKCTDPCIGSCGANSQCRVYHHSPYCTCFPGFIGDPFIRCTKEIVPPPAKSPPCEPNPCGPFANCRDDGGSAICSCTQGYIGAPPNCAPECTINEDCANDKACVREKCLDPCRGSCGVNADCRAMNHLAVCTCPIGYSGNPFINCYPAIEPQQDLPKDPCAQTPCGNNAICNNGSCLCIPGYQGNPFIECRPECTSDNECPKQLACVNYKCVNPCKNACGLSAICNVYNHIAICECPAPLQGDPFIACRPAIASTVSDPCTPHPCGPDSICRAMGTVAHCSCRPPALAEPPSCRPECRADADCPADRACRNSKCRDPCPGVCGSQAHCQTRMHSPICTCPINFVGDPFVRCSPAPKDSESRVVSRCPDCGPNADCIEGQCRCKPNYFGAAPFCRPECLSSSDCEWRFTCMNRRCVDPCPGACGRGAICSPVAHQPHCECPPSTTGNPLVDCRQFDDIIKPSKPNDPCYPSPCGPGAICRSRGTGASCECEPGLRGDPYTGCRPECLADSDCSPSRACVRSHCRDPCVGSCGVGADCETVNHLPLCSCPPGTKGNAFVRCEEVVKSVPPCDPSPCGPGALCSAVGESAVCACPAGTSGDAAAAGCRPECVVSSECQRDRACVRNRCVDPCIGACGNGAECRVFDHAPICSCPPPTTGDPFFDCRLGAPPTPNDPCDPNPCAPHGTCRNGFCIYPECIVNDDCPGDRACINRKCSDPCVGACGLNAICSGVRHSAVCSCPSGYTGSPFVRCERILIPTPAPVPECVRDDQCADNAACVDSRCSPVCGPTNCGLNARCLARQHRARCACLPGYEGDAYTGCYSVQCHSNNDCPNDESCEGGSCVKVCPRVRCGAEAHCVARGHAATCECDSGARGNPWSACMRAECTVDDDCAAWLACRAGSCQNPCPGACASTALCNVVRHAPVCECPRGTQGNPNIECRRVVDDLECENDAECGPDLACLQGKCKNPCDATSCGSRAVCRVANTLPFRTLVCECPKPLTGDASVQCNPKGECTEDSECGDEEQCSDKRCVPVCGPGACGVGAECRGRAHRAACTCVPPLQGDPRVACKPGVPEVQCTSDSDCGSAEACVARQCVPACAGACGAGALCEATQHRARCHCPPGTAGDPARTCYTPECTSDEDCPFDKVCINGYCQDPCNLGSPCGRDATCEAIAHVATCRCPAGTQGDPRRACISAVCHYNEDCDDSQICDRLNRVCRPACSDSSCAPGALCAARRHRPECSCPPGRSGEPYTRGCAEREVGPECTSDSECSAPLACVNARCVDLCASSPCEVGLVCRTVEVLPLRAVACVCPDGGRVAPDSGCRALPDAECSADADCANSQTCRRGSCVEACKADPCGLNAVCESVDHASRCSCPPEYSGNPRAECSLEPRNPVIWECYNDEECGPERACQDHRCTNPCSAACGVGALCRVIDHKAQCSCPRGFTGDALVHCSPPSIPVGCKANSECPLSQACINGACAEPCACGTHAECNVVRHHPVCYCEEGYSGNPYVSCTKVGCSSDSECLDSDTCYNGACINPCTLEAPCSISAECFGRNHRANCRCPTGTSGNPFTRCQPVECEINADCNDDSVCITGICRHACSVDGRNPCASNAECFARNHAASCRCPPALPIGDPLTYCQKVSVLQGPECQMDGDCPSGHACLRDQCREACTELKPCQDNARCAVSDSVPFRTLICRCAEGYIPDVGGACKPAQLPLPSCSSDDDCNDRESCINRICRNPCNCGENAECFVRNHRPVCSCREGFDGNPYHSCRTVGCRSDTECESHEACVNGNCVSPCLLNSNCGPNADCYVERNQPLCRCRSGFEGDAYEGCIAVECRSNGDCPQDKECHAHRCINPCYSKTNCGTNAICLVRNHIAVCKCEQGYIGSPYVECKPEIIAECFVDADCPPKSACLSSKCVNPCTVLKPCATPAQCEVSPTLPVRTMICTCPPGYISSGGGLCRPFTPFSEVACEIDTNCTSNHACISSVCQNPCECGPNTDCQIKNHKPVCACRPGFIGDARTGCYDVLCRSDSQCSDDESCINNRCVPACSVDSELCGTSAECYGTNHRASCRCKLGTSGNPSIGCTPIGCRTNSDCPSDRLCINTQCIEPCTANTCEQPKECRVHLHELHCVCPPGYQSTEKGCTKINEPQCTSDVECPAGTACLNAKCVNPCLETSPCGNNAECRVIDTLPVRTMICECLPGYKGNALVECTPNKPPIAVCIEGQAVDASGECVPCLATEGRVVDSRGRCVCDSSRGLVARGDECVPAAGCRRDADCDDRDLCRGDTCVPACQAEPCGVHAICTAIGHRSICNCANGYTGNPREQCNATTPNYRTDFPLPEMQVHCLADAVRVSLEIKDFNGVLYVKGYSKDERCRLMVHIPVNQERLVDFTVRFGDCGLVHVNGMASFVLVMQIHPTLLTSNAKAFHIKCIYQTGEKNVTLAFNVSMLTTAGTIANTGPPPTCSMRIVSRTGDEVSSAEIGENLVLQVDVQPSSIYGGFARSCIAKTSEESTNVENEYTVTDADGCATDASIFGDWERTEDGSALRASFNAFKFPSSDNIRFQCNIRVCFGRCQPVNCRGADAFGKRRKREAIDNDGPLSTREDQIREEVRVESNQILALERRDPSRVARQRDAGAGGADGAGGAGDVCVSAAGLAVALALTALLALVAVAAAVACWLVAWRRARPPPAPLPHPPDFPNPLFQR